jgi:hypothetical protein
MKVLKKNRILLYSWLPVGTCHKNLAILISFPQNLAIWAIFSTYKNDPNPPPPPKREKMKKQKKQLYHSAKRFLNHNYLQIMDESARNLVRIHCLIPI